MKQKFTYFFISLLSLGIAISASADHKKALFIGNSYTFYGNMPQMIADIATSLGDTLTHDSSTPGGYNAQQHTTNATTINKIGQGGWDYVSIQCQSQEPSFSPGQVASNTYPFVKQLDSMIQANNTCAETLMFMTWGRKNGDASNCAVYPPICTYDGMQQRLRDSYLLFANDFGTSVAPVGAAWKKMRDLHPTIDLYNPDESHPSVNGTYLAACVFYCTMFKKSCVGSMFLPGGVGNGDAFIMQQIASTVVLDSLENWQSKGGIPDASFTYAPTAPPAQNFLTFTNTSKRFATSSWNFGDGTPPGNPATNPVHPFPATGGTFTVCLEVTSACGKKDSSCQKVTLNNVVNTHDFSLTDKIKIGYAQEVLSITSELSDCTLNIMDINGRKLRTTHLLLRGRSTISLTDMAKGIYLIQVKRNKRLLKLQKIHNY